LKALRVLVGLVVLAAAGFVGYVYFSGGSGTASAQLTTPPLDAAVSDPTGSGGTSTSGNFLILPEESIASFRLTEVLFGEQQTVVGNTSEVAGQVSFDAENPQATQISDIIINARTFQRDSRNRDRAIRSPVVLNSSSDEFEFVSTPSSIDRLSGPVVVGKVNFTVTGDLDVKGTSTQVTFDVTAVLETERLIGRAETQVLRSDFGIGIPRAPGVADVSEQVTISLEFVASKR
jgi:polyisoprenoid-binding protein YceI